MANKIYVGNLNYRTNQDQLAELFGQYGEVVEAVVIMDRYTNQSRGFGFVQMAEADAAEAAISALDGTTFDGRALKVNEAKERAPRNRF